MNIATTPIEPRQLSRFMDRTTPPHILTLVLIAGIGALNINIILPSLPAISEFYKADYSLVQLAVSAYLAMTAVLQLITGPLSDRYGRRPVLLGGFFIFIIATLAAALAPNIESFLAARLVQAVIVSGFTLSRAIVRDMVPMDQAASMIGYVTMGMTLVPMIGPSIGGILQEFFGWQAAFYFTAIAALIVLLMIYFDLQETNSTRSASMAEQIKAYPELLASRRFWGFSVTALFASGTFFAFIGGAPYVATQHLGLSPSTLGLYFMFLAIGYMLGNFLTGRYSRRIGIYPLLIGGNLCAGVGVVISILYFMTGGNHALGFFGPLVLVGAGNGLTLPTAMAGIVSVRPHLAGSAAGLGGALQIGGGAALSVIGGMLLSPTSGPLPLLWLMFGCCIMGVISALYTRQIAIQMMAVDEKLPVNQ